MERSGGLIEPEARAGQRRTPLQREEFDSSPRHLRENLEVLEGMLEARDPDVRRRVRLAFGELAANWQVRFRGAAIEVVIEVLPGDAVRVNIHHPVRMLSTGEWDDLVSGVVASLVDDWGTDRRMPGRAWFEFRPHRQPPGEGLKPAKRFRHPNRFGPR